MNDLIANGLIVCALISGGLSAVNSSMLYRSAMAPAVLDSDSTDSLLGSVRQSDKSSRDASGKLLPMPAAEHLRRGNVYLANRVFDNAREHFLALIKEAPHDERIPTALFGVARSFFLAGDYQQASPFFDRVAREYPATKEGRDGLSYFAASLLRSGLADRAATQYIEYTQKYPSGDRLDSSYLNIIDAYREAGQISPALEWIDRTRTRFVGTVTESNALFARLRLDVSENDWSHAIATITAIRAGHMQSGVQTSQDELSYLRAYSLEHQGHTAEAIAAYSLIPDSLSSYYGRLATGKIRSLGGSTSVASVASRRGRVEQQIRSAASQYPAPYREKILIEANRRGVDPRLVLSIMRQESGFRPWIKSPAAARGLLQLTIDTALKYSDDAGFRNLADADLYRADASIAIGTCALSDLQHKFPGSPEAVAAAYNGGDDNVMRWTKRMKQKDPGVFAAEIGFSETKDYVFKVMANYRAYTELYTRDLRRSS